MTDSTVDLDTCDREPIHLIGAVQPHGAMIAVDEQSFVIEYASDNLVSFVGIEPGAILGAQLAKLIGEESSERITSAPLEPTTPELLRAQLINIDRPDGTSIQLECLPHKNDGFIILEFLSSEEALPPLWEDELLRRGIISKLIKPDTLSELADASAKSIRDLTGFDRVMIYKFAEDKHGEVIAESTNRPDSFLGLHYPASDIPDPARRHFTLNVMRSIPDIKAPHIPITSRSGAVANADSARPLDLTYAKLRAVAPVHVEYLTNMGVGASLSISLIINDELWGLVACHHYGPRLVSASRLRLAELLGNTTSALLQSIENTLQLRKSMDAEKVALHIEQSARSGVSLQGLVEKYASELMQLSDAQGLMLLQDGNRFEFGAVPEKPLDFQGLRGTLVDGVATTSQLSDVIEMDEAQKAVAAGAALLDLSDNGEDCLVLLRGNFDQTIHWAGKPDKIETKTEDGITRLSPRGSFALWSEERRGKSRPFDALDRDAFQILRRALFALNSLEHERAALKAQQIAEAKEVRIRHAMLEAARASSMGELASAIAHELSQPLTAVSNYVSACRQELKNAGVEMPERAEDFLDHAVFETARAGDLVRRIRNFIESGDLNLDYVDLNAAVKQGVDLALVANQLPELQVDLMPNEALPDLLADQVQIGQVMFNLMRNSMMSMVDAEHQKITIQILQTDGFAEVHVRDTGSGVPPSLHKYLFEPFQNSSDEGMGIGLSLCRSIVEAHDGRIWANTPENGAEFVFQIPIRGRHDE